MKKSVPFILALIFTISLFWGCDDTKTVTVTEYLPVNISEVIDTINLEVYDFVKKDTILDTVSSDTAYSTSSAVLDYGSVLYSLGVFADSIKEISVDRQHIRNAVVLRYLEIYDTISSDTASDTVIIETDTIFYDSLVVFDSTEIVLSDSTIIISDTVFDTIITENSSYMLIVNGSSLGYIGLGYLMYSGLSDISIKGLMNTDENSMVVADSDNIFILSSNKLQKVSNSVVTSTVFTEDSLSLLETSSSSMMRIKGNLLYYIGDGSDNLNIIDISSGNLSNIDTIPLLSSGRSLSGLELIGSKILINSKADNSNDVLKSVDNLGEVSFVNLYQKGKNQAISSINDSLLVVLTPKQDSVPHGMLEIKDLSNSLNTTVGLITSARFVPQNISDLRFYSYGKGYVLDNQIGVLYKVSFSQENYGNTFDFLDDITSDVASYTFDENNLFISTNSGELLVYNHNDLNTVVKKAEIAGGAAGSLSILTK